MPSRTLWAWCWWQEVKARAAGGVWSCSKVMMAVPRTCSGQTSPWWCVEVRACCTMSGSFGDLCRAGNRHHQLQMVPGGAASSAGAAAPRVTGTGEVMASPSCWQEALMVGTAVVALTG